MAPLKFCANISMLFNEVPLLARYSLAEKAGFKAVECAFPSDVTLDEFVSAQKASGLEQLLINLDMAGTFGTAALKGKEEEFQSTFKKTLDYCAKTNCNRIHIMSGKPTEEFPGSLDVLKSNLKSSIKLLEQNKVIGLIEPINHYSVPGYFMNNFDVAEKLVKEINSPWIRLQLDLFHLQFLKGDLTNNIKKYLAITGHIQIAQCPARHEPNSPGEINYPYILKLIEELGYEGFVGLEYKPAGDTNEGLKWLQEFGLSL